MLKHDKTHLCWQKTNFCLIFVKWLCSGEIWKYGRELFKRKTDLLELLPMLFFCLRFSNAKLIHFSSNTRWFLCLFYVEIARAKFFHQSICIASEWCEPNNKNNNHQRIVGMCWMHQHFNMRAEKQKHLFSINIQRGKSSNVFPPPISRHSTHEANI